MQPRMTTMIQMPAFSARAFSSSPLQKERPANFYEHDDVSNVPRICLDDFYESVTDFKISDEEALEYMTFAAEQAMVSFKD